MEAASVRCGNDPFQLSISTGFLSYLFTARSLLNRRQLHDWTALFFRLKELTLLMEEAVPVATRGFCQHRRHHCRLFFEQLFLIMSCVDCSSPFSPFFGSLRTLYCSSLKVHWNVGKQNLREKTCKRNFLEWVWTFGQANKYVASARDQCTWEGLGQPSHFYCPF